MTAKRIMTFEEFQATKVETASLGTIIADEEMNGRAGLVYLDVFWIEDHSGGGTGRYSSILTNYEVVSDNLEEVERALFDFVGDVEV